MHFYYKSSCVSSPCVMGTPPPHESFPWASAVAIAVAYVLGWVQWHWSYLIPLFWVLVHTERRQLRFCWVELQRHAEARSAARAPGTESLYWALATLRAVWPMFEQGLSAYTQALMDPVLEACKPRSLGIFKIRIKRFSYGGAPREHRGDAPPLPPFSLSNVHVVSKTYSQSEAGRGVCVKMHGDFGFRFGEGGCLLLDLQVWEA